jgi:SAM-dependent methyltransferase
MVAVDPEWWRTWFGASYLALYDDYLQERTPGEVDQLEALLHMEPPMRILDLPCGHGRHAIELARRGYDVTGIDLASSMLEVARKGALAAGVSVRFLQGDMREPIGEPAFDLVVNLFTSLGYFSDPEDDRKVAESAAAALRPTGRFLVEVINGERVMTNFQEREWFPVGDATVLERRSLDRATRRMTVERTVHRRGSDEVNHHVVRLYGATELASLLKTAGFVRVDLFGDWDGSPATPESLRVLAVATCA